MTQSGAGPRRSLYGRRRGKKLRPRRQALVDGLLPALRVELPATGHLDPATLFDATPSEVWLEVGFGGGEHLAQQARDHPDVGLIGCEPYVNGVASLLAIVAAERLASIRVFDDDARKLIAVLADGSIGRMFVLFPTPGRSRVITSGASWRPRPSTLAAACCATAPSCASPPTIWAIAAGSSSTWRGTTPLPGWRGAPANWRARPGDWPATRYEAKARRQGRPPVFLRYRRVARG